MINIDKGVTIISGIDTDIGKTWVTSQLYKELLNQGKSVITHKIAQTGCTEISDDIKEHRKVANVQLLPEDLDKTTCNQIFSHPCSPHLAAQIDKKQFDEKAVINSYNSLIKKFDYVLSEGVGGVSVPLSRNRLLIDFIAENSFPVILVSSPKLGSINHTLLTLEAIKNRKIELKGFIYNVYGEYDKLIAEDSAKLFREVVEKDFPQAEFEII